MCTCSPVCSDGSKHSKVVVAHAGLPAPTPPGRAAGARALLTLLVLALLPSHTQNTLMLGSHNISLPNGTILVPTNCQHSYTCASSPLRSYSSGCSRVLVTHASLPAPSAPRWATRARALLPLLVLALLLRLHCSAAVR